MTNINTDPKRNNGNKSKILISGAGIAGLTQAYWLAKLGFDVTIIERSAELRDEGYMIDFSAEGIQIADAMGILDRLIRWWRPAPLEWAYLSIQKDLVTNLRHQ